MELSQKCGELDNLVSDLELLLNSSVMVKTRLPQDIDLCEELTRRSAVHPISIVYGETYDQFGPTFDSLKYYCWLSLFRRSISAHLGVEAKAEVLIADVATTRNEVEISDELLESGLRHQRDTEELVRRMNLEIGVILQSSFFGDPAFLKRLDLVKNTVAHDAVAMSSVRNTVADKYRADEEAKGWTYALEEIASILPFDVKVGPPREQYYDDPARIVAADVGIDALVSILLTPTLPLGLPMSTFLKDPDLAISGVTPYKAGSKGLRMNRILLGPEMGTRAKTLLESTPVLRKTGVANPILELAGVCDLIEWTRNRCAPEAFSADFFLAGSLSADDLKGYCLRVIQDVSATLFSASDRSR